MKFLLFALAMHCSLCRLQAQIDSIYTHIKQPPPSDRPGVYWYFMDGNRTKAAMAADLESMTRVGFGNVGFLEVIVGVPLGPVDLLTEEWKELVKHAGMDGQRLGSEITLGTG